MPCTCKNGPVYKFDQACCVARFLATLPNKQMRREWLARIMMQRGAEFVEAVKAELRKMKQTIVEVK